VSPTRLRGNSARGAWFIVALLLAFMVAFAAGCGDDDDDGGGDSEAISEIGEPEGELSLICWASYCEDGSNDPKVDWISDFEQ
jgi:putative spermidine/putrescine transport system substrate-binding protein